MLVVHPSPSLCTNCALLVYTRAGRPWRQVLFWQCLRKHCNFLQAFFDNASESNASIQQVQEASTARWQKQEQYITTCLNKHEGNYWVGPILFSPEFFLPSDLAGILEPNERKRKGGSVKMAGSKIQKPKAIGNLNCIHNAAACHRHHIITFVFRNWKKWNHQLDRHWFGCKSICAIVCSWAPVLHICSSH